MATLRLVLGDQLSRSISSLENCNKESDIILICEVMEEASYVKHHKKKIAFLFSAMRHFAEELMQDGYQVNYIRLDSAENKGNFFNQIQQQLSKQHFDSVCVTMPGEYRLLNEFKQWPTTLNIPVEIKADTRFICSLKGFQSWAEGRKQLRMEFFYRELRKHQGILLTEEGLPEGGQWNFDAENRKPPKQGLNIPPPFQQEQDAITQEVLALVEQRFPDHFGELTPFHFAVTQAQAQAVLQHFIQERLPYFGDYQDAMLENEPWMYHSHISFYLNSGLLLPMECIEAAEQAYRTGQAPLNAVEGFIRQILGWREYVRGIYWMKMPEYAELNFFEAERDLPDFFWTADTPMNCLKQCIKETQENAYAHHIQRLMVIGNW